MSIYDDVLIIKPSAKPFNFYNVITFDTESLRFGIGDQDSKDYTEKQTIFNYDLYDGKSHYYGLRVIDYYKHISFLISKYDKITLIGHFIRYDLQILGLMNFILDKNLLGLDLKTVMIDNVVYVKFRSDNKTKVIQFLDSYNYFKASLQSLAEKIGISKIELDDYKLHWQDWNEKLKQNGEKRVKTDCEVLYKVIMQFINDKDFIHGISLASTSFKTFKGNYLKRVITFPKVLIEPALLSYRGGRTELYKVSSEPVYLKCYDINSLYPFVMRNNKYSYQFHREINNINFDDIENEDYNYLFNIDYQYQDKPLRIPIVIKDDNGKLTQLYSAKNVWLTGKEVLELYKDNVLISFRKGYEFLNDYLFTDFIDYFYGKRENTTNELSRKFYKDIQNTSYGKLAQHKGFSEIIPYDFQDEQFQFALFQHKNTGISRINVNDTTYSFHLEYATIKKDFPKQRMNNPFIASEITANARLYNFYIQKDMRFENVWNTDTDSFFTNREYPVSTKLGKLKLEKSGYFMFYDVKDYSYVDDSGKAHITLKGIPKDSIKIDENTYIISEFSTLKTQTEINTVNVKNTLKKLKRMRDKLQYIEDDGLLIGIPK